MIFLWKQSLLTLTLFYFILYIEIWEGTASLGTVPYVPCSKVQHLKRTGT